MLKFDRIARIVDRLQRGDSVLSIVETEKVPAKTVLEAMRIVQDSRIRALEDSVDLLLIKMDAVAATCAQMHANITALLNVPPAILSQRITQVEEARAKNPMVIYNFPDPRLASDVTSQPPRSD